MDMSAGWLKRHEDIFAKNIGYSWGRLTDLGICMKRDLQPL